jgi:hypothetical protein
MGVCSYNSLIELLCMVLVDVYAEFRVLALILIFISHLHRDNIISVMDQWRVFRLEFYFGATQLRFAI